MINLVIYVILGDLDDSGRFNGHLDISCCIPTGSERNILFGPSKL